MNRKESTTVELLLSPCFFFSIFVGIFGVLTNLLSALEMEVGPLNDGLLPLLNFVSSFAFSILVLLGWLFYCIIAYSSSDYKDNDGKPSHSFILVFFAWLFSLVTVGLAFCDWRGIELPVIGGGDSGNMGGGAKPSAGAA